MFTFTYQPTLRPELPHVDGPVEYREQRALFERIDLILSSSGLEQEFINRALNDRKIDTDKTSAKSLGRFALQSVIALRSNIARKLIGLAHRGFCARLADSSLLQWFLHVGETDNVVTFAKSSSDRFSRWVSEQSVRDINEKFIALLAQSDSPIIGGQTPSETFGLAKVVSFDDVYFDSTCLKANIHFPTDWVLLRDAARTLMKATTLIRKHGLKNRMPQEPLKFLSDMNTLCMKMTAKGRSLDGRKQGKKVMREMKTLEKCIAKHAKLHLKALKTRRHESDLSEGRAQQIIERVEKILDQIPAAIKQAHERIIGGRKVANGEKILSLYDNSINVIQRGKAGAAVEFGNKLWLGENADGIIVDYKIYKDNPTDSSLTKPALIRLLDDQKIDVKSVWGDRGLSSKPNGAMLDLRGIRNGLCPRDVSELSTKLATESGYREGLKRRSGIEARIGILTSVFLGKPLLAKGFDNRELAVGWSILTHNLWVVARMAETEKKRKNTEEKKRRSPIVRAA